MLPIYELVDTKNAKECIYKYIAIKQFSEVILFDFCLFTCNEIVMMSIVHKTGGFHGKLY